jgi:hypothetical protein
MAIMAININEMKESAGGAGIERTAGGVAEENIMQSDGEKRPVKA